MSNFSIRFALNYDETTKLVFLNLEASFDCPKLTNESIESAIEESEYADFFIKQENIDEAVTQAHKLCEQGQTLYSELKAKQREKSHIQEVDQDAPSTTIGSDATPEEDDSATDNSSHEESTQENESLFSAQEILASISSEHLSFDIAEKRDASISIGIDEDNLKAFLSIETAYGGEAASEEKIRSALSEKGITFGIDENIILEAAKVGTCEDLLVAKASKPKKGKPSRFKALVSEQITTGPTIDEKGRANYHDINEFVIVEPGKPLMKRIQPGAGKPGTDVLGKVIPPIPGDVLPFSADLEGASISEESKDILIATMKGHPVIQDRGVSVSNVLMLKNVGLSTGNVDFDGSVCVDGDVTDGVKIEVTGDLTVKGVVGKATIKAGGNVVILQGLIGGSKDPQSDDEDPYGAHIESGGSVSAHFMTRAQITAEKHIVVPEYISHSDLNAKHQILVGQSSGKGNLFGGRAQAFDLIAAKVIGSTGGTPTEMKVGAEGDNIVQLRRISKEKRLNDQNTYDVNEALHKISLLAKSAGMTPQMKDKVEKLSVKLEELKTELSDLKNKEEVIKTILMKSKKSRVVANQKVYNNTTVHILGSEMSIKEESIGGSFRFEARRVVFEP